MRDTEKEILTPHAVDSVFEKCVAVGTEPSNTPIIVAAGIMGDAPFVTSKIDEHHGEIAALLEELPDTFKASGGGGMSFLNACEDRHGRLWTGVHGTMERLFMLGMAAGLVVCLMPRDMWSMLPGGMPYYMVKR